MSYPAYRSLRTPPPFAGVKQPRRHGPLGTALPHSGRTKKGWTGPVLRRDPSEYQAQMSVGIARCPWCAQWTGETNTNCSACRIPLPMSFHKVA